MTDPTQFLVELSHVHRVLTSEGVLGKGRDFITGIECSLHLYSDKFKRVYVMQEFGEVDQTFVSTKMTNLAKTAHSNFVSNLPRVCMISTRKTSKGLFDLNIFYDATGVYGYSLEYAIKMKIKNSEKFGDSEVFGFFWQLSDFLLGCGQHTGEYLQITPVNIFWKIEKFHDFNLFPNNFGLHFTGTKWAKTYHNPNDQFWQGKRSLQTALSATMFTLGMVLLELCSLQPSDELYSPSGEPDQKLINKRIQAIKITRPGMLCGIIKCLLKTDQKERLSIKQIYSSDEYLKSRKIDYYSNKANLYEFKTFEGLVSFNRECAVGEGLDVQLNINRGQFQNGVAHGFCMREKGDQLISIGVFNDGSFLSGTSIHKNQCIYIGQASPQQQNLDNQTYMISKGIMIMLNVATMQDKKSTGIAAFSGLFENGVPCKGIKFYLDGRQQVI